MEKISANNLKPGHVLVLDSQLWVITKNPEHVKPGKGPAYVQAEMKNVKTGTKKNERFSSSDYLDKAFLEQKNMQYLYTEGDDLVLMDTENYEQINVTKNIVGEKYVLLVDNMLLKAEFFDNQIISMSFPQNMVAEVAEADPAIKGGTVAPSYKTAILTNGLKVKVPNYVESGEKIVINTEDLSFVERAKQ